MAPFEWYGFYGFQNKRSFFHINRIGVESEPVFWRRNPAFYGEINGKNDIFLPGKFIFVGEEFLDENEPEVAGGVLAGDGVISGVNL